MAWGVTLMRPWPRFRNASSTRAERRNRGATAIAHGRLPALAVVEHFEADQLVDVARGQRGLIELHAELLHANGGDVDHKVRSRGPGAGRLPKCKETDCTERSLRISTVFSA